MKKIYIFLTVLIFLSPAYISINAQDFYYGVYLDGLDSTNELMYQYVGDSLKMNTVVQYANGVNSSQKQMLERFNVIAQKASSAEDAVMHYSFGYYTKWEAEDTTINNLGTGVKAKFGSSTSYLNTSCWTSGTNEQYSSDNLLWGPHYRQDKKYRLTYLTGPVTYNLKFRIAAEYLDPQFSPLNDSVCNISVVFTYLNTTDSLIYHDTLKSITLFDTSLTETFKDFTLTYDYFGYQQHNSKMSSLNQSSLGYDDTWGGTGIQFHVTWYGKMKLYIDKFEVYDQEVGNDIANNNSLVRSRVSDFVQKYNGWNNIPYFFNLGEPQTIDLYTPAKIVDNILDSLGAPKGVGEFYPQWDCKETGTEQLRNL